MEPCVRFIDGKAGKILCTGYVGLAPASGQRLFLIVPPFAEEMNKSRHVLARLARALAEAGHAAIVVDLFGTGDSEGDFGDATLALWQADVLAAAAVFDQRGGVGLIGLRSGALIAASLAQAGRFDSLMLLQPQLEGQRQIDQMLRMHVAAAMFADTPGETAADLRSRLATGQAIEIAGYRLSSALVSELERLSLKAMRPALDEPVRWIEVARQAERGLSPASRDLIALWRDAGIAVRDATVECDAFWAAQEIAQCDALADTAVGLVAG